MTVKGDYAYVGGYSEDGDGKAGALWRYRIGADGRLAETPTGPPLRVPDRAQGLNVVDGELWVTYESGSQKYDQNVARPREHIQRIPLEQLDLDAAGISVDDLLR